MALIFFEALKPTRGTIRIVGLRWVLWIVSALPGVLAARATLESSVTNRPYFTDAADPLPLSHFGAALGELGAAVPAQRVAGRDGRPSAAP